ncbi:MAG: hypothetical protein RLY86_3712, partial [Pseudomonadota bacterium]
MTLSTTLNAPSAALDAAVLYAALLARDPAWDGRAFVGVTSTGIFCRLTCPARKPKRENCRFFARAEECRAAGFRPCLRCNPTAPAGEDDPLVRDLLGALEADPGRRWTEADIAARGHDPSTVRRLFNRLYGMTFLEMARLGRLGEAFGALATGARVIEAQVDAGFESGSGFRAAFTRLLGRAPGRFTAGGGGLAADWLETPLGPMVAVADARHLYLLEFIDRPALPRELTAIEREGRLTIGIGRTAVMDQLAEELAAYFAGRPAGFTVPLAPYGTPFMRAVWDRLRSIPPGETRSYRDIAAAIGRPEAVRAVARANGANRIALV